MTVLKRGSNNSCKSRIVKPLTSAPLQLEKYDDNTLAYLPRPFIASMIIRDPRGVVLEEYEKSRSQCVVGKKRLKVTTSLGHVETDALHQERRRLQETDLTDKLNVSYNQAVLEHSSPDIQY